MVGLIWRVLVHVLGASWVAGAGQPVGGEPVLREIHSQLHNAPKSLCAIDLDKSAAWSNEGVL